MNSKHVVSKIEKNNAIELGYPMDLYLELRQLGMPHSFFKIANNEKDVSDFLRSSRHMSSSERAIVSTESSIVKLESPYSHFFTYKGATLDLILMSCRVVALGISARNAPKVVARSFNYFINRDRPNNLENLQDYSEAIAASAILVKFFNGSLKKSLGIIGDWVSTSGDSDDPWLVDAANLLVEIVSNWGIDLDVGVRYLSAGYLADFDYCLNRIASFNNHGQTQIEDFEEELMSFSPVEIMSRYVDLVVQSLFLATDTSETELWNSQEKLLQNLLILEGFKFIDEFD